MNVIHGIELKQGSREEVLPDFSPDFPCITSYVELDRYVNRRSPWHWHKEVEVFYMVQGSLEYRTPQGKFCFPEGSGGFVNANVLHMTKAEKSIGRVVAMLHIFDPLLVSGQKGSVIEKKYVIPLTTAPQIEVIALYPQNPDHEIALTALRKSFQISEENYAYELRLREAISEVWLGILQAAKPVFKTAPDRGGVSDKIKMMLVYIYEHYGEKITVQDISASAFISERECFRAFHDCLNTSPTEYLTGYRIQRACQILAKGNDPVTAIAQSCGLGSSSYFGKVFRERTGMSPTEYRNRWQNNDKNRQK